MAQRNAVSKIRKRDGRIVPFDQEKIINAIFKAAKAVGIEDRELAKKLSGQVVAIISEQFSDTKFLSVEEVQDIVEQVLIQNKYAEMAKAYILYRQKRTEIREAKRLFGVWDDQKLGVNAIKVLKRRYLLKDEEGKVIETPSQMFRRVARAIAMADSFYNPDANVEKTENEFYELMANLEFLPNSPTLMNAGTELGQLSACFVLPVEDSIESIFDAVKFTSLIHRSGGGTGFSFSRLRPKGDVVKTTGGIASGPVSFMRIFDTTTDVIKQGGRRRGANMGILRVDHPDIIEFITAKGEEGFLSNFNVSVDVTDKFMETLDKDEEIDLINPRTGESVKKIRAKYIFDLIVTMAWKTGDPGLVFIDEINRFNPTPQIGEIESTNPCGEQPLLPYESCNLGSINLSKMIKIEEGTPKINWEKLKKTVRKSIHFLDNVIDINKYPLPEIEKITKDNRKIGLGIMGFADMLVQLRIPYNSEKAVSIAEEIMKFIEEEAQKKSTEIAQERGSFPNFKGSIWDKRGINAIRNATVTTIAPTGTISIIGGCSSGIEPIFAISFVRDVMEGTRLLEINPYFEKIAKEQGFYAMSLMTEIAKRGTIQDLSEVPEDIRKIFVTASDIEPEWHVKMQAAFQKYTDNAVSKTVNLPNEATTEDVRNIFLLAYKLKCKGITVYRYGSKKEQVLLIDPTLSKITEEEEYVRAESEYSGGCATGSCSY